MLKKKFLKFITTLACIVALIFPHTSVVLAAALTNEVPNDVNEVELKSIEYHQNGCKYIFGGDGGTPVLKIVKLDNGKYVYEDAFYCLKGNAYFPGIDENGNVIDSITYKRTIANLFQENPTTLKLSDKNYNALCWLLSKLYLKNQMNENQKDELLEKAFVDILNDTTYEDRTTLDDIKAIIEDDDIDVIQQWAIWYFTNYGEDTLQDIPFTNETKTLPLIDVERLTDSQPDSMKSKKYNWCTVLYQYFINEALSHQDEEFSETSSTYPTLVKKTLTCEIDGDNYKMGPFKVTAPSNDLTKNDYEIKLTDGSNEVSSYVVKDKNGNEINNNVNEIFDTEYYIYLPVSGNKLSKLQLDLSYTKTETKASGWAADNKDYQPLVLVTKELENVKDSVSVEIPNPQPDLALRKYIVALNDKEIKDRTPDVDTTNLKNGSSKTAEYKATKKAVEVKPGDTVTFRIAVYNEGEIEGKATKIIDYLPEGLEFIEDNSTNKEYKWSIEDGKLTTEYLKDKNITAFNKTTGEISSKYVDIVCKISENAKSDAVLTNIAEIEEDNIEDRDSTTNSISRNIDNIDKSKYKGNDENKDDLTDKNYFYRGQEDDDDFEKVIVKVPQFDLSLQKFITKINGKAVTESREPVVDTTPLKEGKTDAKYTTVKEPKLKVQVGDIVTYKIRVYNEGEVDGYAETVADYIPEGLGYLVDYKDNLENEWQVPENAETIKLSEITNGTKKLKKSDFKDVEKLDDAKVVKGSAKLESTKLSSSKSDNLLKAYDNSDKLSYRDIEVTCIVLSDKNLKNIAEVTKNLDKDKKEVTDRDSTPDNYFKDDGTYNKEDDDDYEELVTKVFDLSLQKFITKVNDKKITDREPKITLKDGKITYEHPTTPLQIKNGDKVTYTIRVYNEGPTPGYAAELGDNIPTGLKFDPENETNKKYGWVMYDSDKKATEDVSKAVEIRTDYLSKDKNENALLEAFDEANQKISVQDVEVVFTVDTESFDKAIINIAEITKNTDEDGEDIVDIDSTPDNGKDGEDDLDKERIIVKHFDLSLQKFLTKINGKEVTPSREPKVDTTPLKNGKTNANYETVKNPLIVEVGDIVTYKIRVYNEGEVNGYAETVADYLPEGLGYLVNYNKNIDNYWALPTDLSSDNTVKLSTIKNGTKNVKIADFTGVTEIENVDVVKGSLKLTSTKLSSSSKDNLLKAFDGSDKLSYKDIEVTCIVLSDVNLKNIAEVTKNLDEDKKEIKDVDSTPDSVNPKNYPGDDENQDDNDYEVLTTKNKKFDLSLQKFITGVNGKTTTGREPKVTYENGKLSYSHTATPLEVNTGDSITYTIRVYNEGDINGYAAEIGDDIPSGLTFDPNNETNKKYGWVMYDSDKKVTTDASKAVEIRTDYLSKEKSEARKEDGLLKAFDAEAGNLYYLDVQAVFTVNVKSSDSTVVNTAEITKDTDEDGNEIEDIDSTPDNKKDGEDDLDKERIHVGYFDLALKKDLTKAIITEDGSTKEVNANNGKLTKVEIHRKKVNSTTVKFVYNITVTNEGTIPGFATQIKDYIPEGLQFVQEDNKGWTASSDGVITSEELAKTLLKPGESASVEVVLRWINGENNLGTKINVAEISEDYNEANDTDDIDSTPNNKKDGEDDIDDAPVILSIATGRVQMYLLLSTTVLVIITAGVIMIKKYVI